MNQEKQPVCDKCGKVRTEDERTVPANPEVCRCDYAVPAQPEPKCDHEWVSSTNANTNCGKCGVPLQAPAPTPEPPQDTDYDRGYRQGLKDGNSKANQEAERRINEAHSKALTDLRERLPKEKQTCDCENSDLGYHTKECDMTPYGYNAYRQEVITIINELSKEER